MAGTSRQALRKAWWQVHKWIALSFMILLIPLGLSGAVLAWDDAIDQGLNPQRYAVTGAATLAPAAYAAAASARLGPDDHISTIRYPDEGGPVVVMATRTPHGSGGKHDGGGKHQPGGKNDTGGEHRGGGRPQRVTVWLNPSDARVLDVSDGNGGLVRLAHNFHGSLFLPGVGRALVGLLGVAMFLMAATGLWLWWPTIGSTLKGLRWRRGDRKLDTNLHHTIGFWIALPLAFQAFTGVWIAWPQMMQMVGLGAARPDGGMDRGRMTPVSSPVLSPDAALAAAETKAMGTPRTIAWPTGDDGPWQITIQTRQGPAALTVDDETAAVDKAPKRPETLSGFVRHLHDGSAIGWGWRLFMLLWAFAPTALGITGLTMWLRGRRWRADVAKRLKARGSAAPLTETVSAE